MASSSTIAIKQKVNHSNVAHFLDKDAAREDNRAHLDSKFWNLFFPIESE